MNGASSRVPLRLSREKLGIEGHERGSERDPLLTREWLVTNGLGGYACGTVSGVPTRRYHALLVAALPAPFGRMRMLGSLSELLRLPDGRTILFAGLERAGGEIEMHGIEHLEELRLERGLPVWRYVMGDTVVEKRVWMPHRQNTVRVDYRLLSGAGPVRLKLRPAVNFTGNDEPVGGLGSRSYRFSAEGDRYEIESRDDLPPLRMRALGERTAFTVEREVLEGILYRTERARGYESGGSLWCPGYFRMNLSIDRNASLVASTESWDELAGSAEDVRVAELARRDRLLEQAGLEEREGTRAQLVLAADQFLVTPRDRAEEAARARASGEELETVIAGYHWFTDWGRDTMISLEGLTLETGRHKEARAILRTFARRMRGGLVPNLLPEGGREGLYHTADATLWLFHALHRYVEQTKDRETLEAILPALQDSIARHVEGTRFGIRVDPEDGLLAQGEAGYQLTWMDAKVGDWVVTPRRGKAVEINALWYNALVLLGEWLDETGSTAAGEVAGLAERTRASFNERFWLHEAGHLYDVVDGEDGDDPACRPNQLFAISLDRPVLDPSRWKSVVGVVREKLWTPVGLRTLSPDHPDYKRAYFGDLRARDAAYHQGTVWPWLVGAFLDASRKAYPDGDAPTEEYLTGLLDHLEEGCIGSIAEIFDAEPPFTPRGCVAQAWSVAEVLRVHATETREDQATLSGERIEGP